MARPPLQILPRDRARVASAAAAGVPHIDIAAALGMSRTTLEKHFRAELEGGAARRRLEIAEAVFEAAMRGSTAAMRTFLNLRSRVR